MSEHTEYRITTMADMLSVPRDRWPDMLLDLATWLDIAAEGAYEFDTESGEAFRLRIEPVFVWVDDGLRGVQRLYVGEDRYDLITEGGK